jgi:hypothetical protein
LGKKKKVGFCVLETTKMKRKETLPKSVNNNKLLQLCAKKKPKLQVTTFSQNQKRKTLVENETTIYTEEGSEFSSSPYTIYKNRNNLWCKMQNCAQVLYETLFV